MSAKKKADTAPCFIGLFHRYKTNNFHGGIIMILENIEFLKKSDPEVGDAVLKELVRQQDGIELIAVRELRVRGGNVRYGFSSYK